MIEIWVDGSYTNDAPTETRGAVVVVQKDKALAAVRCITKRATLVSMRNVGGELLAALVGMNTACALIASGQVVEPSNVLTVYHDYIGIRNFVAGPQKWNAHKAGSSFYVDGVRQLQRDYPSVRLEFVKIKAHTGIHWNEVADCIAANGVSRECKDVMLPDVVF